MNASFKRTLLAISLVIAGSCVFLFNLFYQEAKTTAITKLNEEQLIHARQASRGIEDFFATWARNLNSLAKMEEIDGNTPVGQHYLNLYFEANQDQIRSIARVDKNGVITSCFPLSDSVGKDGTKQKHVREFLQTHQPVISDVFRACDAMTGNVARDRQLTVRTLATDGTGVVIEVSDNGHGLPDGGAEKAFERFFTTKQHGLGLGLTVCRAIIDAHGGSLGAKNNTERGATFYLTVPVSDGGQAS